MKDAEASAHCQCQRQKQRMYEHIKESELKRGRTKDEAKEIAARTVIKHHNERRHGKGK